MLAGSGPNTDFRPSSQELQRRQADSALSLLLSRFVHDKVRPGFYPAAGATTAERWPGRWCPAVGTLVYFLGFDRFSARGDLFAFGTSALSLCPFAESPISVASRL